MVLIYKAVHDRSRRYLELDPLSIGSPNALTPAAIAPPHPPIPDSLPGLNITNPVETGGVLEGSDGTEIVIRSTNQDAWEQLQADNRYTSAPGDKRQYYVLTAEVTNLSSAPLNIYSNHFLLIGDNRVVYGGSHPGVCHHNPHSSYDDFGEVYPEGRVEVTVCFEVLESDDNFVLIHDPDRYGWGTGSRRFLGLD